MTPHPRVRILGAVATVLALTGALLVTTPAAAAGELASDAMTRQVAQGWGDSPVGGKWNVTPVQAGKVASGTAVLKPLAPGRSARALLAGVASADVASQIDITVDALPKGTAKVYAAHLARASGGVGYVARIVVAASGSAVLEVGRLKDFSLEVLKRTTLGFAVSAGKPVAVKVRVTGQNPAAEVSAKAWLAGSDAKTTTAREPGSWALTYSDTSPARVKVPGTVGVLVYAPASGRVATVGFDNLRTVPASADQAPPKPAPVPPKPVPVPPKPVPPVTPAPPAASPDGQVPIVKYPGKRGDVGAAAPGTQNYPVPAGAIFVATNGRDTNPGTSSRPVATVAQALQLVKNNGTVVMRGGNYHESVFVIPRTGVKIQPYLREKVWLDGAEQVTGWKPSGKTWVKDGWTTFFDSSPTYARGKPDGTEPGWQWLDPKRPMAAHPDQVWIDGAALTQVGTRSQVTAETFFVDRAAKQLVIGRDPSSRRVEASTLSKALTIRATNSEIRGIGVRRYATSVPEMGTVTADQPGITLTDVTIVDNATTGFYTWGTGVTLNRVTVARNGLLGAGASQADKLTIRGMLSVGNNAQGFNRAPVSGALKIGRSRDVTVTDSSFIDNPGQGPWFDESVYDITFKDNDVWGNGGYGLVIELSERAEVVNNLIGANGKAGVLIANSGNVSIWNNTIAQNSTAPINITQDDRRASNVKLPGHDPRRPKPDPTVPWVVRNVQVVNNVVTAPSGDCLICVRDWSREFTGANMVSRADGNVYHRPTAAAIKSMVLWSLGKAGTTAYTSFTTYVSSTGRDKTSTFVDGGTLVDAEVRILSARAPGLTAKAAVIPAAISDLSGLKPGTRAVGVQAR